MSCQRILIRSTNWIGDVVMSLPAVQRLHELDPHAEITVLCHAKLRDIWRRHPAIHDVITFDTRPDIMELRARAFEIAILFPNSFRSAWEAWRAGIPHRIGFPGHKRRGLLTDVVPDTGDDTSVYEKIEVTGKKFQRKKFPRLRHQSHRYLDIVSYLGGNRKWTPPRIYFAYEDLPPLSKYYRDDGRPLVGINPGAEFGPAKRWPAGRFAEAACLISHESDCRWILFGGPGDIQAAHVIERTLEDEKLPPGALINVAGQTSLLELFMLLKQCNVLLTNDTGPMHLAEALGVPVVAVFGSTSPELTGPLSKRSVIITEKVECNPCFLRECPIDFRCMNNIKTEKVAEAVLKLL